MIAVSGLFFYHLTIFVIPIACFAAIWICKVLQPSHAIITGTCIPSQCICRLTEQIPSGVGKCCDIPCGIHLLYPVSHAVVSIRARPAQRICYAGLLIDAVIGIAFHLCSIGIIDCSQISHFIIFHLKAVIFSICHLDQIITCIIGIDCPALSLYCTDNVSHCIIGIICFYSDSIYCLHTISHAVIHI